MAKKTRNEARLRRHRRVRKKIFGIPERTELRADVQGLSNIDKAQKVGQAIADRAKKIGIEQVVFDRGGYKYIGRVKAMAEAAREGGLKF